MRLISKTAALAAMMLGAASAAAPSQSPPVDRMTQTEAALVQQSLDRGTLIYAYDKAAWHGTDDLKIKLPDFASKVGGWIVDGPANAPQIIFFDLDEANPRIVYVADFKGTELVSSRVLGEGDDRSLSPGRKAMAAARRAALGAIVKAKTKFCSKAMPNTVVLPPVAPGGPTLVYFFTPQAKSDSIPMGGHHLVEVSAEGEVGKPRPFTKTCMEMPLKEADGKRPSALLVTHLLDPVPTEVHVFSSLAAELPIYVSTARGKRIWAVEGPSIRLVDQKASR